MAEVDWEKIIRAAQSKKKDEEKRDELEKRLRRMEGALKKVAVEKEEAAAHAGTAAAKVGRSKLPVLNSGSLRKLLKIRGEEDRMLARLSRLEQMEQSISKKAGVASSKEELPPGFKIVRVPRRDVVQFEKATAAAGQRLSSGAKAIFSNRRNVAAMVGAVALVAVAWLFFTGNLKVPDTSGLAGIFSPKPAVTYVCSDGLTTVENLTMCPTTTTTTIVTTTTTTVPATTTTTVPVGPAHSISLVSSSCNAASISVTVMNSGTTSDSTAYMRFFVDGTENTNILCVPLSIASRESTVCTGSASAPMTGLHTIEVRGLVNTLTTSVNCG